MPIECEVSPRPGAMPADLKALGSALLRWYVRECRADGIAHSVDTEALIELLNGRVPVARVPRPTPVFVPSGLEEAPPESARLNGYELPAAGLERLREAIAGAQRSAALLRVRERTYDRTRTIASLREHLPPELVGEVLAVMRQLGEDGTTMIVVTHEIAFARDIADHVLFMDAGTIAEHGPAEEVLVRPANPRTRAFLSRFHHAGALRSAG